MMLSSTAWGKFCDHFGRRRGLMCAALLTFVMGLFSSAAPSFRVFLLFRGLTGVGIGGIPQSYVMAAPNSKSPFSCIFLLSLSLSLSIG
jgi:MFS family permease